MANAKKDNRNAEHLVAKAYAHPLRVQIMAILNEGISSPNLLSQRLGRSLNLVAYHVRVLEKYDCIELIETKQRRGATEHFYRAIRRQFLNGEQAAAKGTPAEEDGLHLESTSMVLDRHGRDEVAALLKETLDRVLAIQSEASKRLAGSKEGGIPSKVEVLLRS